MKQYCCCNKKKKKVQPVSWRIWCCRHHSASVDTTSAKEASTSECQLSVVVSRPLATPPQVFLGALPPLLQQLRLLPPQRLCQPACHWRRVRLRRRAFCLPWASECAVTQLALSSTQHKAACILIRFANQSILPGSSPGWTKAASRELLIFQSVRTSCSQGGRRYTSVQQSTKTRGFSCLALPSPELKP